MKYILSDSILFHDAFEDGVYITAAGDKLINIKEKEEEVFAIFEAFMKPRTYEEAYQKTCEEIFVIEDEFQETFEFMRTNNLLKEYDESQTTLNEFQLEKYKRQISSLASLPGNEKKDAKKMQQKICDSHVCIIGVGGTGSHLGLAMASIGVEKMTLIDFDKIELSNTSRQILYDETDVGKYKIDVAKEKLQKYNSRILIDTHNIHITSPDDLMFIGEKKIDLLICCADTPRGEIQRYVDAVCTKFHIPWFLYGPFQHSQIMVGPLFVPGKSKTYNEIYPPTLKTVSERVNKMNQNFVASICDPYNGFASQFAAIEAFKFLTGNSEPKILNRRYYVNTDEWEMEHVDYV
ncbi:HesA/MoeB/ThiF family protein [[Clostridium] polysaccharolyticum]|jgi:molybdopterin/thiamine biosynthesis adenylyltransferase|uniref:Molybdopterin or thiamine biosynthesis adenylyltransferase n=1 Tax=[Clostridium] polysaccharolyticum TaxID=29364 RepID=A0A1I0G4W9_9FIRM|nr:ThiF family adenylyltransferase [[Clostridium] polysaccharolyticum]SET65971.1 Molybdopterin or thiamine biosynthesis adenylyltransferase [[Clostridium] polysaccharolyticum]